MRVTNRVTRYNTGIQTKRPDIIVYKQRDQVGFMLRSKVINYL